MQFFWKWLEVLTVGTFKAFFEKDFPEILVLELGVDKPKDMDYLLKLVKPRLAILTEITSQYISNFGNLDKIAKEYEKLVLALPKDGLAILNYDDARVKKFGKISRAPVLYYGLKKGADLQAFNIVSKRTGQSFSVKLGKKKIDLNLSKFGRHHIYAFLISLAVSHYYEKKKR